MQTQPLMMENLACLVSIILAQRAITRRQKAPKLTYTWQNYSQISVMGTILSVQIVCGNSMDLAGEISDSRHLLSFQMVDSFPQAMSSSQREMISRVTRISWVLSSWTLPKSPLRIRQMIQYRITPSIFRLSICRVQQLQIRFALWSPKILHEKTSVSSFAKLHVSPAMVTIIHQSSLMRTSAPRLKSRATNLHSQRMIRLRVHQCKFCPSRKITLRRSITQTDLLLARSVFGPHPPCLRILETITSKRWFCQAVQVAAQSNTTYTFT